MPKQPSAPPSTALGVWLTGWLADHPEITHAALAADIGVSKGLISQWATGAVRTLEPPNLAGLARATDVELSFLEGLVYGSKAPERESMATAIAHCFILGSRASRRPSPRRCGLCWPASIA